MILTAPLMAPATQASSLTFICASSGPPTWSSCRTEVPLLVDRPDAAEFHSVPPTVMAPDELRLPLRPTPPPSPPAMYGPLVLSKASVKSRSLTPTFLHEQSAHVNVFCAR